MSIIMGTVLIGLTLLIVSLYQYLNKQATNTTTKAKALEPSNELAIVTGGSGAIGSKIITALSEKGIKAINLDIVAPAPTSTDAHAAQFYKTDISNIQEIESTAHQIRLDHGKPTILINNAAIGLPQPILSVSSTQTQKVFETNIISHFHLLKAFLPDMVANNHGHIVTVASMVSFMTQASNVDYACTKTAALALHEGLKQELKFIYKAPGVQTTIVHPSWVRTPNIQLLLDKGVPATDTIVEAEDVASAIVEQIMLGAGAQILLPRNFAALVIPLARGFPWWVQEKIRDRVSRIMLKVLE